ncbi:MAG: short-chain dehydrogenase/reductase, partial [Gemmatimonadetes bacterium]|nr:short-chain dehydrogenase/reductase [Gemmatimonadota bacterium]
APLHALAEEIGGGAFAVPCDVSAAGAADRALGALEAVARRGPDILVNNAGAFAIAPAGATTLASFRETLETNLVGPFALVSASLAGMRARGAGHIVSIGSVADRAIFPGNAAYSASKFGLRALHEVLRAELRGSGVRTTLVSPGAVDTALWDAIDPDSQPGFTPRAQMLDAGAVAEAVLFAVLAPPAVNVDELRLSRS